MNNYEGRNYKFYYSIIHFLHWSLISILGLELRLNIMQMLKLFTNLCPLKASEIDVNMLMVGDRSGIFCLSIFES